MFMEQAIIDTILYILWNQKFLDYLNVKHKILIGVGKIYSGPRILVKAFYLIVTLYSKKNINGKVYKRQYSLYSEKPELLICFKNSQLKNSSILTFEETIYYWRKAFLN